MRDVYTTDHVTKPEKYHTTSKSEDREFYAIKQAIYDYNKDAQSVKEVKESEGYFEDQYKDVLPGSVTLSNGTRYYRVDQDEMEAGADFKTSYQSMVAESEEVNN